MLPELSMAMMMSAGCRLTVSVAVVLDVAQFWVTTVAAPVPVLAPVPAVPPLAKKPPPKPELAPAPEDAPEPG
jgi:hypothetical protein